MGRHRYKFILLSACILLAGTLAAGFAARAVVLPRTGEAFSAGVLNVPSVLGQTAEEVLFPPWPLYGAQPLDALSELTWTTLFDDYGSDADPSLEKIVLEYSEEYSNRFLSPFSLFGAVLDNQAAFEHSEVSAQRQRTLLFLKDLPARSPDGTPLSLSFAYSDSAPVAISYLVRPAQPQTLTEAQQEEALERVKTDLRDLLTSAGTLNIIRSVEKGTEISVDYSIEEGLYEYAAPQIDNAMTRLLDEYFNLATAQSIYYWPLLPISEYIAGELDMFTPETSLDDALAVLDSAGLQIQIVSTPEQIIILFTYDSSGMLGVYYDIQLQQYSGIGLSYG